MATVKDVAKLAGVSPATVSRVINNHPSVKPEIRQTVLGVMESRGIQLHSRKQEATQRSRCIGLIVPRLTHSFSGVVAAACEEKVTEKNHMLMLGCTKSNLKQEEMLVNMMIDRHAAGILLLSSAIDASADGRYLRRILERKIPLVLVDVEVLGITTSIVLGDSIRGTERLVQYLCELGHHKICFVSNRVGYSTMRDRLQAYRLALLNRGMPVCDEYIVHLSDSPREAMTSLMTREEGRPTAMIVGTSNDIPEVMGMLNEIGIQVPQDLSVVSFDSVPSESPYFGQITSIMQPGHMMGVMAVELLFQSILDPERSNQRLVLEGELVPRQSCRDLRPRAVSEKHSPLSASQ